MGRNVAIVCLFSIAIVLVIFGINYYFFSEPKIIAVYKKVDYRKTSVVIIFENVPSNHRKMYEFWLKIKPVLKEKYDIEPSKNTNSIVFMKPIYKESQHIENEFCFSEYINSTYRCIDKNEIVLGVIYNFSRDYFRLFFHNPFCVTDYRNGKNLSKENECFR